MWNSNEECVYFSQHGLYQSGEIFEVRNSCLFCIWLMLVITSWFENVASLSFIAKMDLAKVLRVILFSKLSWSLSFQHKITLRGSFNNRFAEWNGCTVLYKYKMLIFSCLIILDAFLYSSMNSFCFYPSLTLFLKITWYTLPMVRCQTWWTFPKNISLAYDLWKLFQVLWF